MKPNLLKIFLEGGEMLWDALKGDIFSLHKSTGEIYSCDLTKYFILTFCCTFAVDVNLVCGGHSARVSGDAKLNFVENIFAAAS